MKKFTIALLALAAALSLASCVQDVTDEGKDKATIDNDKNAIAFTLASQIETRSADESAPVAGTTISLDEPVDGQIITLEETVATLDPIYREVPETRGTPVYTSNFFAMSGGSFKGLAYKVGQMSTPFIADGLFVWDDYFQKWVQYFEEDPWGDQTQLLFYARLAKDNPSGTASQAVGVVYNSYQYLYSETDGQSMTFSYRSPLKAEDQQDILYACRTIDKAQTHSGIPILFYHALTGVKFATANDNGGAVKTFIDKVEFTGLYGYGKCTVKPVMEGGQYVDAATDHSSATAVSWANVSFNGVNSATASYSQEFSETTVDYTSGSFASKGDYPSSFSAAGSDAAHPANRNNLNDADASLTFWLVPQAMTDAVKLKVTFHIQRGDVVTEPVTAEIDFGHQLSGTVWKPGELRTYTLKTGDVDVVITDEVVDHVKSEVKITNVGNLPHYVRAMITAQWFGKDVNGNEGVAFGYLNQTAPATGEDTMLQPWELGAMSGGVITGDNYGGTFAGLPGTDWVLARDGFFYYKNAVPVNEETGSSLFRSYTLDQDRVPTVYYLDVNSYTRMAYSDVRLVMEIPVQAIEAKEGVDWKAAWGAALGAEPVEVE